MRCLRAEILVPRDHGERLSELSRAVAKRARALAHPGKKRNPVVGFKRMRRSAVRNAGCPRKNATRAGSIERPARGRRLASRRLLTPCVAAKKSTLVRVAFAAAASRAEDRPDDATEPHADPGYRSAAPTRLRSCRRRHDVPARRVQQVPRMLGNLCFWGGTGPIKPVASGTSQPKMKATTIPSERISRRIQARPLPNRGRRTLGGFRPAGGRARSANIRPGRRAARSPPETPPRPRRAVPPGPARPQAGC